VAIDAVDPVQAMQPVNRLLDGERLRELDRRLGRLGLKYRRLFRRQQSAHLRAP